MLNAALHHFGITEEDDFYPTQVAGVYVSFDTRGCEPRRLVKAPGDVLHLGMPALAGSLPSNPRSGVRRAGPDRGRRPSATYAVSRRHRRMQSAIALTPYTFMMGAFDDALESSHR